MLENCWVFDFLSRRPDCPVTGEHWTLLPESPSGSAFPLLQRAHSSGKKGMQSPLGSTNPKDEHPAGAQYLPEANTKTGS